MLAKFRDETTELESTANPRLVVGRDGKQPWKFPKLAVYAGLPLFLGALLLSLPFAANRLDTESGPNTETESATTESSVPGPTSSPSSSSSPASTSSPSASPPPSPSSSTVAPEEPDPQPVEVQAVFDGEAVTISGSVLDEAQRASVVGAIASAMVGFEVDDQLEVSGGEAAVPGAEDRLAGLATAIEALVGAPAWIADLDDATLSLVVEGLLDGAPADSSGAGSAVVDVDAVFDLSETITAVDTTVEVVASAAPDGASPPDALTNETETS